MKKMKFLIAIVAIVFLLAGIANATDEGSYQFHGPSYDAVTTTALVMRDVNGEKICVVPEGKNVSVLGIWDESNSRAIVRWFDEDENIIREGTVWLNFLRVSGLQENNYAVVSSRVGLNQRDESGNLIQTIPYGETVQVLEESGSNLDRVEVVYNGEKGNVLKRGIKDTFISVDISDQFIYEVYHGKIAVVGPCVTGNVSQNNNTPTGVYSILSRQTDFTMRKVYYTHYAMRIFGAYFIHDAPWRKSVNYFGGDYYKTAGSHGCINLPYEVAKAIFEGGENFGAIPLGTTVVLKK